MHDADYKRLYGFRRFFAALMHVLAPDWARRIDFSQARQLSAEYPEGRPTRYGDMLWDVVLDDDSHLLVPIEFQMTADPTMPLRIASYTANALLEWTREHPLPGCDLPLALPIVIYGGSRAWRVPTTVTELYPPRARGHGEPDHLAGQLACRYHLLDEQRGTDPLPDGNLVTHLVEIARARSTERMIALLETVQGELGEDEGGALDRAVTMWIKRVLIEPPSATAEAKTLKEVLEVLKPEGHWATLWYEDGIAVGQKEGREEGREEGRQEGRQEGRREGRREGIEQAFHQLVALRFGDDAVRGLAALSLVPTDPARLRALMATALECATAEEFLARMQNGGPTDPPSDTRRDLAAET